MQHEPGNRGFRRASVGWLVPAAFLLPATVAAGTTSTYQTPPQALVDIVDAPQTPFADLAPGERWLLLMEPPANPSIAELARRELRLAGLRIRPATWGPSRRRTLAGLSLVAVADGARREVVGLPDDPEIDHVRWSPDGAYVAFTRTAPERTELWVLEVASGRARRLTDEPLSLAAGTSPAWAPDSRSLFVPLVPARVGPEPPEPTVPTGPVIRETDGRTAAARTYQDLLENPHDEALFAHYLTAQLARVELDGGVTRLGEADLLWRFDPSPDGRYLLVETLHRPFSYLVPAYRFPRRIEVWDGAGHLVHQLADLPLQESVPIPFGSVPTGPREVAWRDDAPATLAWVEALDGGDAGAEAAERDRLFLLAAPFDGTPTPLLTLAQRFDEVRWGAGDRALVTSRWWKTRHTRTWVVRPDAPDTAPELLFDRSWEDRYGDPGAPLTAADAAGRRRLVTGDGGRTVYLAGDGASPEGERPFLDAFDLETKESRRLFRSTAPYYEEPLALLAGGERLLTRREAVDQPPNYYVRQVEGEGLRALTRFPHPLPQLAGIQKELIRYRRDDGVELNATLYLPAGYQPRRDGPLPVFMWAYPREFKNADLAGQVTDSPYRFDRVDWRSPVLWLTQGYAVLDGPTMPIIGEGDAEPNDRYVEQLVASAKAAVDEVVRRGVGDRRRMAIGGHSYGAFMAANLLAHSDLFAAGIARSGAYNRTLTPFGFQSEERTLWEAPEVYFTMSPFLHAEAVDEPILLIHGEADNNSGTFPLQSERFYHALKGLGATARLVMLPDESHGYQARESVLHVLWEMNRWLETYVKNGPMPRVEGEVRGR